MVKVRSYRTSDFNKIQNIYQQGIDTGIATFETRVKSQELWELSTVPGCRLVAENDRQVVGWAALSQVSSRQVYRGVAEETIYVAEKVQGKGIGHLLLSELIKTSEQKGFWTLQAGIFPVNKASIRLHEKNGFRLIGVREKLGRLKGIWHDVLLYERRSLKIN